MRGVFGAQSRFVLRNAINQGSVSSGKRFITYNPFCSCPCCSACTTSPSSAPITRLPNASTPKFSGWKCWPKPTAPRADSYKLDLAVNGQYVIELFSFPSPPPRPSYPEAAGLRHLAFAVPDVAAAIRHLEAHGVPCEPVRVDELTGRRFTFFADPDGLPLELYEV